MSTAWINDLFKAIDNKDSDRLCSLITDDGVFKFGNMPEVKGNDAIKEFVAGFFESLKGLDHTVPDVWDNGDFVTCRGEVTYTRHDDTTHTVPFCNVFKMKEGKVDHYQIYIDNSDLYK